MRKEKRFSKSLRLLSVFLITVLMSRVISINPLLASDDITTISSENTEIEELISEESVEVQEALLPEAEESTKGQDALASETEESTKGQDVLTSEAEESMDGQDELVSEAEENSDVEEKPVQETEQGAEESDHESSDDTALDLDEKERDQIESETETMEETMADEKEAGQNPLARQLRTGVRHEINLATASSGDTWGGASLDAGVLTISDADPSDTYLIYTSLSGTAETSRRIVVKSGVEANIIIDRVTIVSSNSSMLLESGAIVNLTLNGENSFTCTTQGGNFAVLSVAEDAVLTINETEFSGSLSVGFDGNPGGGAAIGSDTNAICGTIRIESGAITATGSSGTLADGGAAIGGGKGGDFQKIEISGGVVNATSSNSGAAIGGGSNTGSFCTGEIIISGGEVEVTGISGGAGIGSGVLSVFAGTIIISNGNVTATGGTKAAGIGSGEAGGTMGGNLGKIVISGGVVEASGGDGGGAGIGGGDGSSGGDIYISGGEVTAISVSNGCAGIGGGGTRGNTRIEISGGKVQATGASASGFMAPAGGAGIGGGKGASIGMITISGGEVDAQGGTSTGILSGGSGAGIGGSGSGSNSDDRIEISGGTITATAGNNANDIGGGEGASVRGEIIITGGSIYPSNSKVSPAPTNGSEPVYMVSREEYAGSPFVIAVASLSGTYYYHGVGHPTMGYIWIPNSVSVSTNIPQITIVRAIVQAPTETLLFPSGEAVLRGSVINTVANVGQNIEAYFEWGTSVEYEYGKIPVDPESVHPRETVSDLTVGTTYHYRYVLVTEAGTRYGEDMKFTMHAAPSVDVTHSLTGTDVTLHGIYNLNGGDFVGGTFEVSTDGVTWKVLTEGTTPGITNATGVNKLTGQLDGLVETPSVTIAGFSNDIYYYRFSVTNSKGTESVEGSFERDGSAVTMEYRDMGGTLLAVQPNPDTTWVGTGEEYRETAVLAQLTSNSCTYRAEYYILSSDPTQKHSLSKQNPKIEAFTPENEVTITVYYISTMIDIVVPSGVKFHSIISDGGDIVADNNNTFINHSELALRVGLQKMTVVSQPSSDELTFVSDVNESTVYRRLHLNLVASDVVDNSFTNSVNNIIPEYNYTSPAYMGTLDGTRYTAEGEEGTGTGGSGTFEVGGRYVGDYPVYPLKYEITVTFEFCLEIIE